MLSQLILLCFASVCLSFPTNPTDAAALNGLCAKTNIAEVQPTWCTGNDPCQESWHGVTCNLAGGVFSVTQLIITNNAITGQLDPATFFFDSIEVLDIENAQIFGTLPDNFFKNSVHHLVYLTLLSTPVTFTLTELFHYTLDALQLINVVDSPVTGSLSGVLIANHLQVIESLTISYTEITGTVTSVFSPCPANLVYVDLSHNKLSGRIQNFVCHCNKITYLDLSNNLFTFFDSCIGTSLATDFCDVSSNLICSSSDNNVAVPPCVKDSAPTAVVDLCGVCGGDSQECLDCTGTPHGTATYDACDVCGGDGLVCSDCAGVPNGPNTYDICDVCGGDGTTCSDCTGVPNGPAIYDVCDVCNGPEHGPECVDCAGTVHGTKTYDACDVCGGDDSTCKDCKGIIHGHHTYDKCDVCGGHNKCLDCAGVPYGHAHYDRCGVCKGHGDTCGIPGLQHEESSLNAAVTWLLVIGLALCVIGGIIFWWCVLFRRPRTTSRARGTVSFQ